MSLQDTSKLIVVLVDCRVSSKSELLVTLNDEWQRQTCFDIQRSKIKYFNYVVRIYQGQYKPVPSWSELDSESYLRGEVIPLHDVKPHSKKCCTLYLELVFLIGSMFVNSPAIPGEVGASSSSHLPGFVILSARGDHREAADSTGWCYLSQNLGCT